MELSWNRNVTVRVGVRRQRDSPGAGHREARRRGVDLAAQIRAAQREIAGDLAHRFLVYRQIADAELEIVSRHVERAVTARRRTRRGPTAASVDT